MAFSDIFTHHKMKEILISIEQAKCDVWLSYHINLIGEL